MTDELAPIPDEKEIAFEVWFLLAGKNAAKTRRLLLEPPGPMEQWERGPIDIPERTIRDWARRYNWDEKADKRWRDLAPGVHSHVKQQLAIASIHAAEWVMDVATGKEKDPNKVQATVNLSVLDRTGHLPETRKNDGSIPTGPTRNYAESVADKSINELKRMLGFSVSEDE